MTGQHDSDLVAAALAGDSAAVGAIYDRYSDRVYSFCLSRLRNGEQAADATHETFVRAAQRLATLRDPSRLRSWLFAIARNQIVDQARQRERTTSLEAAGDVSADLPDHDADLLAAESAQLLWEAAGSLQERDLNLLELQLRQGLEGPDLADALGVTTSHLHVLQSRMKDRIEKALGSLLIARHGCEDCDRLQGLLSDWDGRFTLAVRSRVTRHVEGCDVCQDTKAAVLVPGRYLGVLPLVAAPLVLRTRTAGAMEAALAPGSPPVVSRRDNWSWRDDGFPDAVKAAGKRGALWFVAVAAAILALAAVVGGVAYIFATNDSNTEVVVGPQDEPEPTATAEPDPTAAAAPTVPPTPDGAVLGDSIDPDEPELELGPFPTPTATPQPTPTSVPPTAVPPTPVPPTPVPPTPVPTPVPVPGSIVVGAGALDLGYGASGSVPLTNPGELPADWTASATAPFAVTTTGQVPGAGGGSVVVSLDRSNLPDRPVTGTLTINTPSGPETVSLSALVDNTAPVILLFFGITDCSVTVEATDAVGIASVVVNWSLTDGTTGTATLTGSAPLFTGAVGPVPSPTGGPVPVTATAVVTDVAGNSASRRETFGALCP